MPSKTRKNRKGGSPTKSCPQKYIHTITKFCNYIQRHFDKLPEVQYHRLRHVSPSDQKIQKFIDKINRFDADMDAHNATCAGRNEHAYRLSIYLLYDIDDHNVAEFIIEFDLPINIYNEIADQINAIGYIKYVATVIMNSPSISLPAAG